MQAYIQLIVALLLRLLLLLQVYGLLRPCTA
jgi:hypothetical protein